MGKNSFFRDQMGAGIAKELKVTYETKELKENRPKKVKKNKKRKKYATT